MPKTTKPLYSDDPAIENSVRIILNTSVQDGISSMKSMGDSPRTTEVIQIALDAERSGSKRKTIIKALESRLKSLQKDDKSKVHIVHLGNQKPVKLDGEIPNGFEAAVAHAKTIKTGMRIVGGASFAFGLELQKLKEELGVNHGGDHEQGAQCAPWKELVTCTGFSYRSCQNFMNAAEKLTLAVTGSRKKADQPLKKFLKNPPREWNAENYDQFCEFLSGRFDASTFTGIMAELGFTRSGGELPPPPEDDEEEDEYTEEQLELFQASDFVSPIMDAAECRANPKQFKLMLSSLPLETIEVAGRTVTGLKDLVSEMQLTLNVASALLASKTKPTPKK